MSQENVEIVQSIFAAWGRGDFRSVEWAHPEITFVVADGPAPGSWSGVAAMAEAWRESLSAFEHLRTEADEYRALDDERCSCSCTSGGAARPAAWRSGTYR